MKDLDNSFSISRLIAKEALNNISENESRELHEWVIQSISNRELYNKLGNKDYQAQHSVSYNLINIDSDWKTISGKISRTSGKRYIISRFFRYAAIMVLPLLVAGTLFFTLSREKQEIAVNQDESIIPGSKKARLILSDGYVFNLDNENDFNLLETDGYIVKKRKGSIDYTIDEARKDETLIFHTVEVPHGGEYHLILSDGTRVYMNSLSKLKYPVQFNNHSRVVELTGEAYFQVAHDPEVPFILSTGATEIKVTGTSFNVNAYENAANYFITLEEGSIEVKNRYSGTNKITLQPDQQAIIPVNSNHIVVRNVNASIYASWRNGRIMFRDEKLEDIMDMLSRWYDMDVFYLNPSLKELRFGGSLNKYESIAPILEVFELTNKLKYKINGREILFCE